MSSTPRPHAEHPAPPLPATPGSSLGLRVLTVSLTQVWSQVGQAPSVRSGSGASHPPPRSPLLGWGAAGRCWRGRGWAASQSSSVLRTLSPQPPPQEGGPWPRSHDAHVELTRVGRGPARNGAGVGRTPGPHQTLRSLRGRPSAGRHPAVPWYQKSVCPRTIAQALGAGGWPGPHAMSPGTPPWINWFPG